MTETTSDAATVEVASVEWHGRTFTFPADVNEWPADVVEAFEQDKAMTAVHGLLGDDQWAAIRKVSRRTVGEVGELFELLAQAAGFESSGE